MPTIQDIRAAMERIRGQVVLTPCAPAPSFEGEAPGRLHFKLETRQRTGSFKDRGALNRLLHLDEDEKVRGVITASAGNHAQALAFHAGNMGLPATVVMPETTPLIKVSNTRRYGARVILHGQRFSEAIEESKRLREEEGLVMIHAYDDEHIIAGQGTIALELLDQLPDLDLVVVPIGGGGVISGIALGLKAIRPEIRVVGVEVEAAPSARLSRDAGHIVEVETADTLADGIAVKRLGDLTFPIVEKYVDDIVVVGEEDIARAILVLLEREKLVVEGAGAAPLAALLSGKISAEDEEKVVAVLCGGNIDVNLISRIIDRGLVDDGRLSRLVVRVSDRPGSLARLTSLVAQAGANVLEVGHQRAFADISVGGVEIVMHLETRGREHVNEILEKIRATGTPVEEAVRPVRSVGRSRTPKATS